MTNEVIIKEQPQITKIAEFFETTGLVEFFTEQYGYPRELICREGLAFANKITLHDLQENNANRQFKNCFRHFQTTGVFVNSRLGIADRQPRFVLSL